MSSREETSSSVIKARMPSVYSVVFFLILCGYGVALVHSFQGRWFNASWTTDDATQQIYPFYRALIPNAFQDDIIYEVMRGYLPPIHWWIGYGVTLLTKDPIMTGHWMMLIQVLLTGGLLAWGVYPYVGGMGASAAVLWFLHSRQVLQRLTCGLPRGWSAVVLAGFIAFSLRRNRKLQILFLVISALIHPPTTAIICIASGCVLIFEWLAFADKRKMVLRDLGLLAVAGTLILGIVSGVTKKPAYIGDMVGPDQVAQIPEFQNPGGRFPFYPLQPVLEQIDEFAFQAFFSRFYRGMSAQQRWVIYYILVVVFVLCIGEAIRRSKKDHGLASPWLTYLSLLMGIITIYTFSRIWFFKLYVPDRHLQLPLAFFWISFFTVLPPLLLKLTQTPHRLFLYYCCLGGAVYLCSDKGLHGVANFNYPIQRKGSVYQLLRDKTPLSSVVAGDPRSMDVVPLLTQRSIYVGLEQYHPFYPTYLVEMRRRFDKALRAAYAKDLRTFKDAINNEPIDYFIFNLRRYRIDELANVHTVVPHQDTLARLIAEAQGTFAWMQIPIKNNYVVYRDKNFIAINVERFKEEFHE